MQSENHFLTYLKDTHQNYLCILAQNENYILAVPPADLLPEVLDEKLLLSHILQISFNGKDLTSLAGRQFRLRKDKFLQAFDTKNRIKVTGNDIAYFDSKSTYKRMILDNSLDERFFSSKVFENQ